MSIQVARKKRDSYQHGDLREALVQAGLKLLAESGVEGLSPTGTSATSARWSPPSPSAASAC
jgi:hypothetical protein